MLRRLLTALAARRHGILAMVFVACFASQSFAQDCLHWSGTLDVNDGPGVRERTAMAYDSDRDKIVLFGGDLPGQNGAFGIAYNDTWEYDPSAKTWTFISIAVQPPGRFDHAMVYDSGRKRVVMVGGKGGSGLLADTWEYNGATQTWVQQVTGSGIGPRSGHAMAYDATRGKTVLFGGITDLTDELETDETSEWDGTTWVSVVPKTGSPGPRTYAKMAPYGASGVVLFGGFLKNRGSGFDTVFKDTLLWDGTDWKEVIINDFNHQPGARSGHQLAYDSLRNRVILFGGNGVGEVQTTYALTPGDTTNGWVPILADGPPLRTGFGMDYASAPDQVVVFGGGFGNNIYGDTWSLRGHPPNAIIEPVRGSVVDSAPCSTTTLTVQPLDEPGPYTFQWRKRVGNTSQFVELEDGFRLSGTTTATIKIDPTRPEDFGSYDVIVGNSCGDGKAAPGILKPADGEFVLSQPIPAPRRGHAMAYDSARGRMVIFGGDHLVPNAGSFLIIPEGQTWEREGAGPWLVRNVSGPPARLGAMMAYDEQRHVSVLFGGVLCADSQFCKPGNPSVPLYYDDTWEWDGTTWTKRNVTGPLGRSHGRMVYDSQRQRIVLFGGLAADGSDLGDLWEWDGTQWTTPNTVGDPTIGPTGAAFGFPPPRDQFGMAYDSDRGALIIHGGSYFLRNANVRGGETWELIGGHWKLKAFDSTLSHGLALPDHMAMAFGHGATLLLALPDGGGSASYAGKLWEWHGGPAWDPERIIGPEWRTQAAMAYDSARHRMLITGGQHLAIEGPTDSWEWAFFDFEPTCGATVCGDAIIDPTEQCEPTGAADCCSPTCTFNSANSACSDDVAACDGACNATGVCVCNAPVCGNGIVEAGEACDDGATPGVGCCTPSCQLAPIGSPCGDPCDLDVCTSLANVESCEIVPSGQVGCSVAGSAIKFLGAGGGTVATADGAVTLTLPPGTGPAQTYAIASDLLSSQFGVGTAATRVLVARLSPAGTVFAPPGATLTFHWHDTDADGIVDGTTLSESDIHIFKDGKDITGPCATRVIPGCTSLPCCDPVNDTFTVRVSSFSEFVLDAPATQPCAVFTAPKLALGKILAPAGDDTLAFQGKVTLPGVTIDPLANGLAFTIADAGGVPLDVTLPPGAFVKATKTGWKVNKKHTSWTFQRPAAGAEGGIFKASIAQKDALFTVKISGKKGTYASTLPVRATITLVSGGACGETAFDVGEQSCAVKSKGKSIGCK